MMMLIFVLLTLSDEASKTMSAISGGKLTCFHTFHTSKVQNVRISPTLTIYIYLKKEAKMIIEDKK